MEKLVEKKEIVIKEDDLSEEGSQEEIGTSSSLQSILQKLMVDKKPAKKMEEDSENIEKVADFYCSLNPRGLYLKLYGGFIFFFFYHNINVYNICLKIRMK